MGCDMIGLIATGVSAIVVGGGIVMRRYAEIAGIGMVNHTRTQKSTFWLDYIGVESRSRKSSTHG